MCVCVGGGGEGTLIFSYIYVGLDHFWGFKILNFNMFGGFQKYHYFWGYEDFVDISLQNWTGFRGHFYTFQGFFLRSMCRMGILFGVAQNYKYFLGSGWYSRYILGVDSRCWVQAYVWRKTWEYIKMSKFKTPKYIIKCAQNIGCTCSKWEQP